MDFRLKGKCAGCKRERFFIRTARVIIMGVPARSKHLFCGECIKNLRNIKTN